MPLPDALPGVPFDPRPIARMFPGPLPEPLQVVAPAAVVDGVAFIPVPGTPGAPGGTGPVGPPGPPGPAGEVNITDANLNGGYF